MSQNPGIEEELTAYIDGELSELDSKRVQAALAADPALARLEQRMRSTVAAIEALPSPQPSQALRRAVLNGLDASPTLGERLQLWLRPSRWVPALGLATAAALAVVISQRGEVVAPVRDADAEQLYVATNMEVLEDLDLVGLESPDDLEVIAQLNSLEVPQ
jgi:anti-sigma factor RsiW